MNIKCSDFDENTEIILMKIWGYFRWKYRDLWCKVPYL